MMIALAITIFMVILIMRDTVPFGAAPLLACLLMVVFQVTDIKTAFGGFSNSSIIMLASFMAIIASLQKTSFISAFKNAIFKLAGIGGFKAYVLLIIIVMLGCSAFGTGSTAYYVLVIGLLSNLPETDKFPPSKILAPAGFAANHPLIPLNTALQLGYVIQVLQAAGADSTISTVRFAMVNLFLSLGFLLNCIIQYKFLPTHPIAKPEKSASELIVESQLPKWKEKVTYFCFALSVFGMIIDGKLGQPGTGYVIPGIAVAILLFTGVLDFKEIREAISQPIIIMSASVIGIADALGSTGLTTLVGETVAGMLGSNVNAFVLVFVFCILTSVLATLTGSTIGTVLIFAPMAIATCMSLGMDPTAAAVAIVISGWCGHFLPIDGMPALVMGVGDYSIMEFWKFTIPQYFIRLLALTIGALLMFPV